jgi:hypothetical protein
MKSLFSLLLLSTLFASGCAHDLHVTEASHHFGKIEARCAGETEVSCSITKDLAEIKDCTKIDSKCCGGNHLLDHLFGDTRHAKFANFIVYFDQDPTPGTFTYHQPVLMWNRHNTRYLYGVQEVYILLLTQYKACFTAYGTTLARYESNPFDILFTVLGKSVGTTSKQTSLVTKPVDFVWYPLSGDADYPVMWLAIASVPVDVNTTDWITVRYTQPRVKTEKGPDLPDECVVERPVTYKGKFLAYNAFFSDNRESRVGVAVALGGTLTGRQVSPDGASNPYLNGYVLAELYPIRGLRPTLVSNPNDTGSAIRYRPTLGIAIGTNITNSPLNELVLGVSIGHLAGNIGVIAGLNYFVPPKPTASTAKATASAATTPTVRSRQHRPFVGIDYSF